MNLNRNILSFASNLRSRITGTLLFIAIAFICAQAEAGTLYTLNRSRTYTAAGAAGQQGGAITTCTNATPVVCTTTSAHNLISGDPVIVTGVATNTIANGSYYVSVLSSTTFAEYVDSGLSVGVAGTAAGTGGTVSYGYDVSGITGDWTLRLAVESLTSSKRILLSIQESADGFVNDIRTLQVMSIVGSVQLSVTSGSILNSLRAYQVPLNRFGVTSTKIRVYVQAIDSSTTAVVSAFLEY